ncbi:glucose-1-phosphate adenylyltransferase subunit GlgD [Ligilactobacillus ceti]|uniref:Glucose-1-phosphate adenylyltransferase n=1 Tax=Ligilactobacillus ceti DSM 22408 TaxID=1122146 RepID=A0A0R2KQI1_9LACO|nr:glucose-1-phosphate adenylyltransferase subunit GlgD [Ligilactobacillus ceti]KRN89990.1 glucose-1-phosphate adenylyltransferase [Ligilactobacillus ceti DSM 22408]
MKANKISAIITNENEPAGLALLTASRPLPALFFDCKYRLMDFALSSVVNANIRTLLMILNERKIKSVFDHLGGSREWGLDSIGSYQYVNFYQDILRKKAEGKKYLANTIEFLQKSKSTYTVIMGSQMLCNIDLKAAVRIHKQRPEKMSVVFKREVQDKIANEDQILEFGADNRIIEHGRFSDVANKTDLYNLCMDIFIVDTEWLIEALYEGQENDAPASLIEFLVEQMTKIPTNGYEYTGYSSNIFDVKSYYQANMELLEPENFNELLFSSQKVITRTKNEVATYFSPESDVQSSHLATGSVIEGKLRRSFVSRRTSIKKDSDVEGAIIMANGSIGEGATVKYAILDKNVVISPGVKVIGTPDRPLIIPKDSCIVDDIYGG